MKTSMIGRMTAALAAMLLMASGSAQATIIYQDLFSRSGTLSGSQLGVATGFTGTGTLGGSASATWTADSGITLNGTVASRVTNEQAFLPFTPQSGYVYTYSLDVDATGGSWWAAFGFSKNNNVSNGGMGTSDLGNNPVGWMLLRVDGDSNDDEVFAGPNYNGVQKVGKSSTGWNTLALALDTTDPQWTVQFYRGGTAAGTPVNVNAGDIDYIFVGGTLADTQFDNLSLTAIPEPGSMTLVCLLGGALFLRRKLRG